RRSELERELAAAGESRTAEFEDWQQQQRELLQSKQVPAELPKEIQVILQLAPARRKAAQQQSLRQFWYRQQADLKLLAARLDEHLKTQPAKPEITVRVLQQRSQSPRRTFVLHR
ncbi:MAG: hypothetical protein ACKPJJ_26105, partial [Planctomycetaceae bacterium]